MTSLHFSLCTERELSARSAMLLAVHSVRSCANLYSTNLCQNQTLSPLVPLHHQGEGVALQTATYVHLIYHFTKA